MVRVFWEIFDYKKFTFILIKMRNYILKTTFELKFVNKKVVSKNGDFTSLFTILNDTIMISVVPNLMM